MNSLRYSYIRQGYSIDGIGQGAYANFYGMSTIEAETRNNIVDVPVQNLVDDLTWTHSRHTLQFRRQLPPDSQSESEQCVVVRLGRHQLVCAGECAALSARARVSIPRCSAFPSVDPSFAGSYNYSMTNLAGLLDYVTTQSNYRVSANGQSGALLRPGAPLNRDFKNNEFEYYAQDSWRIRPNLTINFGLHHTLLQTPYEVNGQQVQPTNDLYQWFQTRGHAGRPGQ